MMWVNWKHSTKQQRDIHIAHHCLHHVGFVVPQRLYCVEHVHDVLLLDHLTDATDGTKRPAASATSPEEMRNKSHIP